MPPLASEALKKHGPLAAVLVLLMSAFTGVTVMIIREQGRKLDALDARLDALGVQVKGIEDGQDFLSRTVDMTCRPKEEYRPKDEKKRASR